MASILGLPYKINQAVDFTNTYKATTGQNIYLGIGKSATWTNEAVPPAPIDSILERKSIFSNLIGAHKVEKKDLTLVVPRVDWTSGNEYFVLNESSLLPHAQNNYAMSTAFRVYSCISKDTSGTTYANPPLATTEPSGTATSINTNDGYIWKFLYDITTYNYTRLLDPSWIPVNYGDTITSLQISSGDKEAYITLGAKYVMIRVRLADTDFASITYRQISLIVNPIDIGTGIGAAALNYTNIPAQIQQYSGNIIYQENRVPVTRSLGQFEEFKIVIQF